MIGSRRPVVYFVCTGNAARSPMAAAMLRERDEHDQLEVRSSGTLVLEGLPMSVRTREALARQGLADHAHRSRQFKSFDAADADLIVVMEPIHITWIRKHFPEAAAVTGSLRRLVRDLPEMLKDLPDTLGANAGQRQPNMESSPSKAVDAGSGSRRGMSAGVAGSEGSVTEPASSGSVATGSTSEQPSDVLMSLKKRVALLELASVVPEPWEEVIDPGAGDQPVFHSTASELRHLVDELYLQLIAVSQQ